MKIESSLIILLPIILTISSCTHSDISNNKGSIVNSGISICKDNDKVYYLSAQRVDEYEYKDTKICMYDGEERAIIAEPTTAISSLYVKGDMLYYAIPNNVGANIIAENLNTNQTSELFCVDEGLYSAEDYIYTENNRDIYFFGRTHGLWRHTDGSTEKLLDADACTFARNHIYYSTNEGLFETDLSGKHTKLLISKERIFEENQDSRILKVLGDGSIYNITCYKEEIYFLIADVFSQSTNGGIFKFNPEDNKAVPVLDSDEYVCSRFFIENDTIYFSGYARSIDEDGIFKSDFNRNAEKIADLRKFFYVNDGVYFYETDLSDFKIIND